MANHTMNAHLNTILSDKLYTAIILPGEHVIVAEDENYSVYDLQDNARYYAECPCKELVALIDQACEEAPVLNTILSVTDGSNAVAVVPYDMVFIMQDGLLTNYDLSDGIGYYHDYPDASIVALIDDMVDERFHMVYPCDLDPFGECPKACQDCANCKGWCDTDFEESVED